MGPRRWWMLALMCWAGCTTAPSPPTTTSVIGPSGGTITLGEVTLVVPAGAVTRATSITITETDEAPAAGYTAYTHVYRFEPQGIAFDLPLSVRFHLTGAAPRPRVVWTNAGRWEDLGGSVSASSITASVQHFSLGFAGALLDEDGGAVDDAGPDADIDAADAPIDDVAMDDAPIDDVAIDDAPVDDAPVDDAPIDVGIDDVGPDASSFACTQSFPTFDPTPTACFTGCGSTIYVHHIGQLTIPETSQLTAWRLNGATAGGGMVGFGLGCAHPDNACTYRATSVSSWEVPAGTYFYDSCSGVDWVVEPPPPPATNTSCANAISLDTALPGRLVSNADLYYFYDWRDIPPPDVWDQLAQAESPIPYAHVSVSVRTVCSDPATEVFAVLAEDGRLWDSGSPGSFRRTLANFDTIHATTPASRYYLVVGAIEPGTILRTRSFLGSP